MAALFSSCIVNCACCALILCFTGLFSGAAKSYSGLTNAMLANLIVLNAKAKSWLDADQIPRCVVPEIEARSGVAEGAGLPIASVDWSLAGYDGIECIGSRTGVLVIASYISRASLTMSASFDHLTNTGLQGPLIVAIDPRIYRKLHARLGGNAAINGHVIPISGIAEGFPNASGQSMVTPIFANSGRARPS
jgi:hypothetical protein